MERYWPVFIRFFKYAIRYVSNPAKLAQLLSRASEKAAEHKAEFKDIWTYFNVMLRLVKAWASGRYKEVPYKTLLSIIAAIVYFVVPTDAIPDVIPGIGYVDDAAVILCVVTNAKADLDAFVVWEQGNRPEPSFA